MKIEKMMNLKKLQETTESKNYYRNTKKLLELYRKVIWRLENSILDMDSECMELYGSSLVDTLNNCVEINSDYNIYRVKNRLISVDNTKSMLELLIESLDLLKRYPNTGFEYYKVLELVYICKVNKSETEILEMLNLSRTTYFRYKKKGIKLLSAILWGYLIPEIELITKNLPL